MRLDGCVYFHYVGICGTETHMTQPVSKKLIKKLCESVSRQIDLHFTDFKFTSYETHNPVLTEGRRSHTHSDASFRGKGNY